MGNECEHNFIHGGVKYEVQVGNCRAVEQDLFITSIGFTVQNV